MQSLSRDGFEVIGLQNGGLTNLNSSRKILDACGRLGFAFAEQVRPTENTQENIWLRNACLSPLLFDPSLIAPVCDDSVPQREAHGSSQECE